MVAPGTPVATAVPPPVLIEATDLPLEAGWVVDPLVIAVVLHRDVVGQMRSLHGLLKQVGEPGTHVLLAVVLPSPGLAVAGLLARFPAGITGHRRMQFRRVPVPVTGYPPAWPLGFVTHSVASTTLCGQNQ